jgi:hypothetical protein
MSRAGHRSEREDLAALSKYRDRLRAQGRLLEAVTVDRCIDLLRSKARVDRAAAARVDSHPSNAAATMAHDLSHRTPDHR